jgi:signal transduction histidine kinase
MIVRIDARAFQTALLSVLDNAHKFSDDLHGVEVRVAEAGLQAIIRVRNFGIGVKEDHEEVIFQPFYGNLGQGMGLGLYVARKVLNAMGGDVKLTQRANPTEFSLYVQRPSNE